MVEIQDNGRIYGKPQFGSGTFGMAATMPAGAAPAMQADINTQKLKEGVTDSYLGNRLTSFSDIDPLLQYGVTIPTWLIINQAMDRYLKFCKGDYNKTVLYKIGNAGDKFSNFFTQNAAARTINNGFKGIKRFFKKNVYDKSALIRAFDRTPSVPELGLVKAQAEGIKGMIAHDCTPMWDGFLEPLKSPKDFDCLGLSKQEIAQIEKNVSKAPSAYERKLLLEAEEFRVLNPDKSPKTIRAFRNMAPQKRAELLKELKVKAMGFGSVKEFELIKKEPIKHIDRILEILQKPNKNLFARISYSDKNIGTILKGQLTGRKVPFSETYNKLLASMGQKNLQHSTILGRGLAKLSNQVMEGATSRIAGGKLAALMQAYFLAEVLIRANRQETTGDKFRSFAERFAELVGFFVFMPPAVQLMHKIGGLQYSGMTPQQVEAYRKAVQEFNDKVMNGFFKNKAEYKAARKVLKGKFRPKTHNPLVWLGRKAGDILTVGLEQIRPYSKHKAKKVDLTITNILSSPKQYFKNMWPRFKDVMRNPKYWFKQVAGYPVRFIFPMLIVVPFLNKLLVKGTHMIFGRPKESLLDKEPQEADHNNGQQAAQPSAQNQTITPAAPATLSDTNLLNKYKNKTQQINGANISHTGNLTPKSPENSQTQVQDTTKPKQRYIPSPEGVKIKETPQNTAELDLALKRAENAEKLAIDTLSI